jgi:hypothetical protein
MVVMGIAVVNLVVESVDVLDNASSCIQVCLDFCFLGATCVCGSLVLVRIGSFINDGFLCQQWLRLSSQVFYHNGTSFFVSGYHLLPIPRVRTAKVMSAPPAIHCLLVSSYYLNAHSGYGHQFHA